MGTPRLKFNNKEIGLRKIDDDLYELKNESVFEKYLNTDVLPRKRRSVFIQNSCSKTEPKKYHRIESFCLVTTINIVREAALLLKSLRKYHDQPIYIICDDKSRTFLNQLELVDVDMHFRITAEKDHLNIIDDEIFSDHKCIANSVHKPAAILKKMEAMEFALSKHNNTFFVDSDIIVLDSLQEYFESDIVLSPHYYPPEWMSQGYENGFYNAGYVFCADKQFPEVWRYMYLNDSTFFEQECMNMLPEKYSIQTFDEEHNVGFWRRGIIPSHVKSFHYHISDGVDDNRNNSLKKLNSSIVNIGTEYIKNRDIDLFNFYKQMTCPKKVMFIHFGKAAGVYVNRHLKRTCMKPFTKYFSWHDNLNPFKIFDRDWSHDELMDIAKTAEDYSFLTQHHINLTADEVREFKNNGWFIFTFLRRPEELLCSLFHWSKDTGVEIRGGDFPEPETLEEMFDLSLQDVPFADLWRLPKYIDELDYVSEFTDEKFSKFLLDYFGIVFEPQERANTSSNKGFVHYRETGDICDRTAWRLLKHPEYERALRYL